MSIKKYLMKRFAMTDKAWLNLKGAVRAYFIEDFILMTPTMLAVMFVADLIGNNEYDYNINLWLYVIIGALLLLLIAIGYIQQFNRSYLDAYNESMNVRINMAEKMRKLPLSFFSLKDPADLTVRMMGDVTMQESTLANWAPALLASLIFTPIICIMLVIWSPLIGLAAVWPVPIAFAIMTLTAKYQKKFNIAKFKRNEKVTQMIQELLECSKDLKVNSAQGAYFERLSDELDAVESVETKFEYIATLILVASQLILKFGIVTVAVVGSILLVNESISLIVFVSALIIVSRIYDPINTALEFQSAVLASELNCERIREINELSAQTGTTDFSPDNYDIVFQNVDFSYDDMSNILNGVSFTAKQGEVTALVGPSGGGKTTVARLSSRFWDIQRGKITLGNVDISTVDPETLLSKFSFVFQDVVLFNASVKDNIRIGKKGATDEEIFEAAKAAMCDDFVNSLPLGYDTIIGENGEKLSGGERQRVSIARAILKDAPVIIMDEATASLDTESETRVQHAISHLIKDKTVLVIAHRMRTIEEADKIVVLSGGKVVEEGKPDDLKEAGGVFAEMVIKQQQTSLNKWSIC